MLATDHFTIKGLDCLSSAADVLLKASNNVKIWTFTGCLGSGKTTLIKSLCRLLKIKDEVVSPTYSLVNEYVSELVGDLYHFDFYRLNNIKEVIDIGFEEYLYSGHYCFIEWPNLVYPILPENIFAINISILTTNDFRLLEFGHKKTKFTNA
jgi:tRNA threonylcarbamoyladenosine biosynthesis protein TsaE